MLRNTQTLPPPRDGKGIERSLELSALGLEMMRARLRRDHPGISEEEIAAEICAFLLSRPGPEQRNPHLVRRRLR